jgi:hypothetical protein
VTVEKGAEYEGEADGIQDIYASRNVERKQIVLRQNSFLECGESVTPWFRSWQRGSSTPCGRACPLPRDDPGCASEGK